VVAIAAISYFVWKWMHRRRLGYVELSNWIALHVNIYIGRSFILVP
jgi:hypothetical protein